MNDRFPSTDKDVFGQPIGPGDVIVHDALGRPVKVHPSRICRSCREILDDGPVCPACGAVTWRQPISTTLTAAVFIAGAFAADHYFGSPWNAIVFWITIAIGTMWGFSAISLWHYALKGVGIEITRLVGGAMLFGGIGWFIDWLVTGCFDFWAILGAVFGACFEMFAELYYFHRDR